MAGESLFKSSRGGATPLQWFRSSSKKIKVGIIGGLALVALIALVLIARIGKTPQIMNATGNLLTKDERKWRLAKAKAHMYSDAKAFADAQGYIAQNRTVPLSRMSFEDRLISFLSVKKIELVKEEPPLAKVRVYSVFKNRTYDVLISKDDLLPFDENAEKVALKESEAKIAEQLARRQESMKLLGKRVTIKPKAIGYVDSDALWEHIEAVKTKQPVPDEKLADRLKRQQIISIGENSYGVVSSVDGPGGIYMQIESELNGKPIRYWVIDRALSVVAQVANVDKSDGGGGRIGQFKNFKLGNFSYAIGECEMRNEVGPTGFGSVESGLNAVFVVVHYSIMNESNSTKTVVADDFLLRDAKGRQFRPSSRGITAFMMEEGSNKDFILSELQPGVERETATVFEIPDNALGSNLTLIVPQKGLFGSKAVEVSIKPN